MKLSPETKHALIIGGGLIVAVVLGIIVFKKYEANSQASQAAGDQASADELAYIESMSLGGGGYAYEGSGGSSITVPTSPGSSTSLAQEIQQIEQAFGFGTSTSGSSGSSGSSSSGGSSGGTGTLTHLPHLVGDPTQKPNSFKNIGPIDEPVAEYTV